MGDNSDLNFTFFSLIFFLSREFFFYPSLNTIAQSNSNSSICQIVTYIFCIWILTAGIYYTPHFLVIFILYQCVGVSYYNIYCLSVTFKYLCLQRIIIIPRYYYLKKVFKDSAMWNKKMICYVIHLFSYMHSHKIFSKSSNIYRKPQHSELSNVMYLVERY